MISKVFFLLLVVSTVAASVNHVPDKSDKAFSIIVEAGAKLLEFDIAREDLNAKEKSVIAYVDQETFISSTGKAINALLPLENLASSFDRIIPAFLILKDSINSCASHRAEANKALKGLISLLDTPEVFHVVLPPSRYLSHGYDDAMNFKPVVDFIKAVQYIAHQDFLIHYYCDDKKEIKMTQDAQLVPSAYFFYAIIKQALVNIFGELPNSVNTSNNFEDNKQVKKQVVIKQPATEKVAQDAKILENGPSTKTEIITEELSQELVPPQDRLHKAILNNSAEEIKLAINAGADINLEKDGKYPLLLALLLKRYTALESLLGAGANVCDSLVEHAVNMGENKSLTLLLRSSVALTNPHKLLERAFEKANLDDAVLLMQHGGRFATSQLGTRLHTSFQWLHRPGSLEFVQEVINSGYDVNSIWALQDSNERADNLYKSEALLRLLVKNGANPNHTIAYSGQTWTPLFRAIAFQSKTGVETLLNVGADKDQKVNVRPISWLSHVQGGLYTPLAFAVAIGDNHLIELLIERDAKL